MMDISKVDQEIQGMVRDIPLHDAEIHVEKPGNWIHILIATPDFEGKTAGERENIIWRELERRLDDETLLTITQCYLMTPEEKAVAMPN